MFRPGAIRFEATIGAGHRLVQLPTGFAYNEGQTVALTERQMEQVDPEVIEDGLVTDIVVLDPFVDVGAVEIFAAVATLTGVAVTPTDGAVDLADPEPHTVQMTATASYDGDVPDRDVSDHDHVVWASDDEEVATVDASGLVTALSVGTADITATYHGESDTQTVTVSDSE